MNGFKPYPAYKDSGVEWLGVVPVGWRVGNLKHALVELVSGGTPESNNSAYWSDGDGIPWVAISDITRGPIVDITAKSVTEAGLKSKGLRVIPAGGLLYSIYASIGKVAVLGLNAATNQAILGLLLDSKVAEQSFVKWWLVSLESWVKTMASSNTQDNLNAEKVRNLPLVFPTLLEQTQIARFLDHETARIDALIEEQQRLIELLKEKRRGIVLSALSDTSLPLVRIGHAVDVISRPVKQREDESYTPIGLFNRDRGLFHKEPREMQDMGDSDFFWIKSGDLIISGQFAWEGAVAMAGESEEGLVVSHRYPVLRGKHGVANTEYLYAILTTKHGDFLLNESSRGAAGRNRPLNLAALLKEKIRIPSKEIQEQVSNLVQNEAKVLTECRQQISLLQERRSALISAAVTGKIDVRNW